MLPWLLLFAVQAVVFYFAYSLPDWDSQTVMLAAYQLAGGEGFISEAYYCMYPNNICLTLIFAAVLKPFVLVMGNPGYDRCVLVLIVFQCLVSCVTGWFLARMTRKLTASRGLAALASWGYVLLIGVSPWLGVPYSNCMTMIVPLMILNLYMDADESRHPNLRWWGIGVVTLLGYLIKPQSAVMGIAVILLETVRLLSEGQVRLWARRVLCAALIAAIGVGPVFTWAMKNSGFPFDEDQRVGMLHYVALGLNRETVGEYNVEDVGRAQEIADSAARRDMYLDTIKERLSEMGAAGLADHLAKKTMINWADGSFGWSTMDYWPHPVEDKDAVLSPLLKDLYEQSGGTRYPALATLWQCLWLGLLTAALAAVCGLSGAKGARRKAMYAMMLSVVGMAAFGWLFETGAQVQMVYVPVYLLLFAAGAARS